LQKEAAADPVDVLKRILEELHLDIDSEDIETNTCGGSDLV
jgi:hypothetical protein